MHRKYHLRYQGRCTHLASLARSRTTPTAAGLLLTLAALLAIMPAQAQGEPQLEPCPGGGYNPTPTAVAVTAVPIVVESTAEEYFVLYVEHDLDGATVEIPVLVKRGAAGTTTLAENVEALSKERYRVEKYLVADPADVDGDCIDDITELDDLGNMNPVNPAAAIDLSAGAVAIPDRETFETLAETGRYVKFAVFGPDTDRPRIYFINTNTHTYHGGFQQALTALGIEESSTGDRFNGLLTFHPELHSADGRPGLYSIWIYRVEPFAVNDLFYTLFAANMPMLEDDFAFHVREQLQLAYNDVALYEASRINILLDKDVAPEGDFVPMNKTEGYGLLRAMDLEDSPNPRDVVIYEALPNELSRVAGIITTVPQTPLSHVNLRAVQDGVPNAFIRGALDKSDINALIGNYVQYTVTTDGYTIRAATKPEIDNHYASSRPTTAQTPQRDLSVTEITPLSEIGFGDWDAFGVKAANVAVLRTLNFPEGTVPDGFAIPFYFYDEFMKHNNFYARIETMLADPDFQSDFDTQEDELKDLRDDIEDADTPAWIVTALATMNESFLDGINRRYRSSTNNEDLPGFSGAGLYDSKSQKPSEDEDDLAKSLKEVYASLWNFRAFIERDFHRIDHLAVAMGVLVHPSYQDEKVNGVAVSFDLIAGRFDYYYVNSQAGEDLVTNPDALSVPEEVLLDIYGSAILLGASNQVAPGQRLMSDDQLLLLHDHLFAIHHHFENLYEPESGEPFAMEIEFKITSANTLAIKQARPWVFSTEDAPSSSPPPPPPPSGSDPPSGSGPGGGGSGGGGSGGGGSGGGSGGGGGPRQTVPDAPRNLLTDGGDGAVTLSWDPPEDDGGLAITDYEYRINGRGSWISIGSTRTTHTVTGLTSGTVYVFQVRAVNAAGSSPYSNRAEATPGVGALDFAHFANGAGIISDLVFVNVATHPIRLGLDFYDKEGNPIAAETVVDVTEDLEITEDGSLSVRTAMEPLGELTISTHGQGEVVSGSVKMVSNGPIGGVLRFDLPGGGVAGVGASPPVRDVLFPARREVGGISTAAAIHNMEEEPIVVSCRLMSGGVVLEEMEIALAAYGQEAQFIEEMFTTTDTSNFVGLVRCTGTGRFTGVAVELDAASRIFTTLPVVPVNLRGRGREAVLDFAHFANGEGITSDLVFVNVETQPSGPAPTPYQVAIPPIRPALYFYDKEGKTIAAESVVEITGDLEVQADGGLSVRTEMEPLGELTISTHGQGELVSGSVRVVSDGPIGGVLRFDLPGIGVAGVGASQPVRDALFPARREGDLSTAAAIRNLGEEAMEVSCQLMSGGIVLEEAEIPLEANGQEARYIEELFPRTDTSDFVGSVRCTAPGEGAFTGVAVELDAGNQIFTTLPVVPVQR